MISRAAEPAPDLTGGAQARHREPLNRLAAAACLLAAAAVPAGAAAGPVCQPRAALVAELAEDYGESRQSWGVARVRGVAVLVETFAGPSGSWTVLRTTPDGVACIMAAGEAFEAAPVRPAGEPA